MQVGTDLEVTGVEVEAGAMGVYVINCDRFYKERMGG